MLAFWTRNEWIIPCSGAEREVIQQKELWIAVEGTGAHWLDICLPEWGLLVLQSRIPLGLVRTKITQKQIKKEIWHWSKHSYEQRIRQESEGKYHSLVKKSHQGLRDREDVIPYRAQIVWLRPWFNKKEVFKRVKKNSLSFIAYGKLLWKITWHYFCFLTWWALQDFWNQFFLNSLPCKFEEKNPLFSCS